MALGPFTPTSKRHEVVEFSTTVFIEVFGLFLPRPRLEEDFLFFIKPFQIMVRELFDF